MFENLLGQKLTISEETLKQPELSRGEKALRRIENLKNLDASGAIKNCKSRIDLAKACGYTNIQAGSVWAGRLVRTGYVKEQAIYDPDDPYAKRYSVTPKINQYNKKNRYRRAKRQSVKSVVVPTQIQAAPKPVERSEGKVAVEYGMMKITFENASAEYIGKILKELK